MGGEEKEVDWHNEIVREIVGCECVVPFAFFFLLPSLHDPSCVVADFR